MKPKLLFLALFILIVPLFTTAQTDTSVYAVFMKGTVKGTQKIWKTDENTYHYFYQIFDRGRGDSLLTTLKTIIQEAQIPESYYNSKNSNYGSNWIHSPPLATGVANGAIETVKDIPVLVSFGWTKNNKH